MGLGPTPALEQAPARDNGGGQAVDLPGGFCPALPRAARHLRFAIEHALGHCGHQARDAPRTAAVLGTTLHGMRAAGEFVRTGDALRLRDFLAGSVLDDALSGLPVGPVRLTTCSACSSGLGAVALGITILRAGLADRVIVGGYDSVSEYSYAGFDSLRLIAAGPPKPFAADRDGMKVAEGYGVLVLDAGAETAARGARPLACIAGFGETSDSFHLTQPHPEGEGATAAIRATLAAAGCAPADIDLIIAHGTATPNNDASEYAALDHALGPSLPSIPVVALKGHFGHTLGGAGAVELVMAVMAQLSGAIPPNAHEAPADPAFSKLQLARTHKVEHRVRTTLNISLGFGGANTCVVLTNGPRAPSTRPAPTPDQPVLTGIGMVLPGALNTTELADLIRAGIPVTTHTGAIPEDRYTHLVGARRSRRMSGYAKLMLAAAQAACRHARLVPSSPELAECCGLLGTTHGSSPFCEAYYTQIVKEGMAAANPVLFAEGVPNAAAAHLSMALGLKGGCQTIIGTRCAGLHALMLATERIRQGIWKRAIVGAAEEFSPVVNAAYSACARRNGTDISTGLSIGEGAVALVIESSRTAATRTGAGDRLPVFAEFGRSLWPSNIGAIDSRKFFTALSPGSPVYSSLGPGNADLASTEFLAGRPSSSSHRSIYPILPELFSIGPLAALAGALTQSPGSFTVIGQEFTGMPCGLEVRKP